jgi:hypothetical protein
VFGGGYYFEKKRTVPSILLKTSKKEKIKSVGAEKIKRDRLSELTSSRGV